MKWLRTGAARREFERFVADSADRLLRTGYLLASDLTEAEDLVQETLLQVARRWNRIRSMDHPAAYARRVLVNLAIDGAARRARRHGELGLADAARLTDLRDGRAERALDAIDTQADLLAALAELPARQRAVIVLRYWEDLPEADVAAILGCSTGTVKSTASRGLTRLRQVLAGERQDSRSAERQQSSDQRLPDRPPTPALRKEHR
jgi:RNA polymerase sigma-70 factor (sigma-E family)